MAEEAAKKAAKVAKDTLPQVSRAEKKAKQAAKVAQDTLPQVKRAEKKARQAEIKAKRVERLKRYWAERRAAEAAE